MQVGARSLNFLQLLGRVPQCILQLSMGDLGVPLQMLPFADIGLDLLVSSDVTVLQHPYLTAQLPDLCMHDCQSKSARASSIPNFEDLHVLLVDSSKIMSANRQYSA